MTETSIRSAAEPLLRRPHAGPLRQWTERTLKEALGADSKALRNMIVRQAMKLASAGILAGTVTALALTRLIETMLYGVSPRDPLVFASVAILLGAVALLASYLPARRAVRIDPIVALRYE